MGPRRESQNVSADVRDGVATLSDMNTLPPTTTLKSNFRRVTRGIARGVVAAFASITLLACAAEQPEIGQADQDVLALDLIHFVAGAAKIVCSADREAARQAFFANPSNCPKAGQMSHFIDAARDVDGVPLFTSVQDFEIRRDDLDPKDVALAFRGDWLTWWKGGTAKKGSTGWYDDGTFGIEIRPLGIPLVSIAMEVPEPVENPEHPELESPELDALHGEELAWDWGLSIPMSGNAFVGTMHILARATEGGVHVREMWRHTEPVAPLVMKYTPVKPFLKPGDDETEARLRLSAFLHLAATQGCAVPRGTGYPGLIDAFESGQLPAMAAQE